jgi:hypothetical protein
MIEANAIWTIIGVNIALISILATIMVFMMNRLDSDIKSIGSRLDGHATRIDQLYRMFVDLVKEKK